LEAFGLRNSLPHGLIWIGGGEPRKEIQHPMAVVIPGGIITSTFLNMIVIPALFLKYGREKKSPSTHTEEEFSMAVYETF
jgi:hypothetical protein